MDLADPVEVGAQEAEVHQVLGKNMKNIDTFFNNDAKLCIREAISEAESITSAEIVTVLTDCSGRYERAEDLAGFFLAIISLVFCWLNFQDVLTDGVWLSAQNPNLQLDLGIIIFILVVGYLLGAFLASRIGWLRRLFCSSKAMKSCLHEKAIQAFQLQRVGKTKDGTGVIIFISLFEHMVFVLGDVGISKHLSNEDFVEVRDIILDGFRKKQKKDGMVEAILLCGQKLQKFCPLKPDDKNELCNDLRIWKQFS